ncbi:LADA_0H05380g1_1 [Lachancea dasiensis]|uniref:LADA_0H05380g1_1 n=1 Tax=Lachancea dasiensis TaxID=1072105 RepID=A0A1G4K180_9SACH|nr:LADA_0H05380g1_1 [Lachancea dasiensis]
MDAFEARLQFLQVIKNLHKTLNASKDNSPLSGGNQQQNDPVSFYLKHYEHHFEDFQQCMLDSAAKMDSLDRLNVLVYWSRLISMLWPRCMKGVDGEQNTAGKVVHNYLLRQLDEIILLVLPDQDWKALTNLKVCSEIVQYLNRLCQVLDSGTAETLLKKPVSQAAEAQTLPTLEGSWLKIDKGHRCDHKQAMVHSYRILVDRKQRAAFLQDYYRKNGVCSVTGSFNTSILLHRMENDRERHKKSKEHLWVTERDFILDAQEFETLWSSCKGMARNDYCDLRELNKIAHSSYMYN